MPTTTNYSWTTPTDGGSTDAWGGILNTLFTDIDSDLYDLSVLDAAKLAKAGGTMTGRIDTTTSTTVITAKGSVSGAQSLDCSLGQFFTIICSGAVTLSLTNVPTGGFGIIVYITNGAAGFTHPAGTLWAAGAAPTLSAGTDVIGYLMKNGATAPIGVSVALAVA